MKMREREREGDRNQRETFKNEKRYSEKEC